MRWVLRTAVNPAVRRVFSFLTLIIAPLLYLLDALQCTVNRRRALLNPVSKSLPGDKKRDRHQPVSRCSFVRSSQSAASSIQFCCHRQESRHISSRPFSACQPRSRFAFSVPA